MKALRSLKTVLILASASLVLLATPSCKKEEAPKPKTLCELLEGDWEVTSYLLGSSETIGASITSFGLEFEDSDCSGDVTLTIVSSSGANTITGEYTLDEEDEQISLEITTGNFTFDIEIDEDDLEMSGTNNGLFERIEAERD